MELCGEIISRELCSIIHWLEILLLFFCLLYRVNKLIDRDNPIEFTRYAQGDIDTRSMPLFSPAKMLAWKILSELSYINDTITHVNNIIA